MEKVRLGDLLKQSREKKGFSIEDVTRLTRIRKEFLEALETENYSKLPERTYALGYFRSYANFLELKEVEKLISILDEVYEFERPEYSAKSKQTFLDDEYGLVNTIKKKFDSSTEKKSDNNINNYSKKDKKLSQSIDNEESSLENKNFFSQNKLVIVLCIFLCIFLFLGYKLLFSNSSRNNEVSKNVASKEDVSQKIDSVIDNNYVVVENNKKNKPQTSLDDQKNNQVVTTKENTVEESKNAPSTSEDKPVVAVPSVNVQANEEKKPEIKYASWPKPTRDYQISVAFAEDVWIQIYKQDNPNVVYLDKIFKAGDIYDIPKVDNISMRVGNYKGIKIIVDSKEIALTSRRKVSVVLNDIVLEKDSLLEKYPLTSKE